MYARSTSVVADPRMLDRGIAIVQDEIMANLTSTEGCIGMSCLVDRESGRCITTSAWQSLETMQASRDLVMPLRDNLMAAMGTSGPLVQEWEIPLMHRTHPAPQGACARLTWLRGAPENMDDAIESFRMIVPALDDLQGFCSVSLLVNRDTGECVSTVVYESADAAMRTRGTAQGLRQRIASDTRAEVLDVAEFELALAHLRVPELV